MERITTTVCYFLQTHRDPAQIERLAATLRAGGDRSVLVVQHNPAGCKLDWRRLERLAGVRRYDAPAPQVRALYSCQVEPYLGVIDWLDREGIDYDWLVGLTGQDYPVKPVAEIEAFLSAARADGFLRYWDVFSPASPWSRHKARGRYWHRYRRFPRWTTELLRPFRGLLHLVGFHVYVDYGPLVGTRVRRTPFRGDFRCYGGWAWSSLRRETARFLTRFMAEHPEVERHYRFTMTPEESVVQTVLVNSRHFELVNDDLRYIDYENARFGSPRILGVADLPRLASGRYHFARKFDPAIDAQVLDRIDRELLRNPRAPAPSRTGERGNGSTGGRR